MGTPAKTQYLRVRNWEEFQHYKDRRPPWIKLHIALTDDYAFSALPDEQKYHLVGIWLLAARTDNKIPNDPTWVGTKIEASSPVDLDALVRAGFLSPWKQASGKREKWSSRYVSADTRAQVLARDAHSCRACGSQTNLEIDHIVPISRGGTGAADNLQVLCRSCNRAKRARLAAEQPATQMRSNGGASVLPRQRQRQRQNAETETNREENPRAVPVARDAAEQPQDQTHIKELIERSLKVVP